MCCGQVGGVTSCSDHDHLLRCGQSVAPRYRVLKAFQFLFVCFVALRPKSTAMVIAGRSVHLTTLFPGQA